MRAELSIAGKALAAACGEVREGSAADAAGDADGGIVPALVALPGSTREAAAVMRVAAEHNLAVVVRGSGSRLGWGTPASRCDLLIDMSRMAAVTEHAAGDLVARVQAGAPMGEVAAVLARAGQEIALDVPDGASVGGVVASGLAGPRRLRYGTPRDLLIGITIVRADGTVARSGGKVVKNVAGYDLGKLMAGSAGTLALITEATFRLHPLPAARAWVTAEFANPAAARDAVAAAANSPLTASAVELSRSHPGQPIKVGVLIEGSADGVTSRAMRTADLLGEAEVSPSPPSWWPGRQDAGDTARQRPGGATPTAGSRTLIRVSCWVSALDQALDAIDAAARGARLNAAVSGSAGAGVLDVTLGQLVAAGPPPPQVWAASVADFTGRLRATLADTRGGVTVLAAPSTVREALAAAGGMTGTVPGIALMRAVKDQFDPGHRMAPGRFPEAM